MKTHPLADLFPPMTADEMASLVEDIKAHGLAQPIVTHEGAILDGRHRYQACLQAGVEPQF
ncbi:MAG: ParB N-terminal domain-containing protein, partial [Verrucomicrobia bacterium]|nr:ParB N-terminal domain-containing protein [Verrucomicrobiota bacterium]